MGMMFLGIKKHPLEWNVIPWVTTIEDAWRFDWLFIFFGSGYVEAYDDE